jgi:cell division protein FtsZ
MEDQYNSTNGIGEELFRPAETTMPNYIKVVGVGGGGGNAVNHMMEEGIQGVDFILCNTDHQALMRSPIKAKVHLGKRDLGAGNDPNIGREAAEISKDEIKALLDDNTKMLFVTAGMGGGTGTGAAPVIARLAKDMGILTVGIVTMPMEREGRKRKMQALAGIDELKKCVDTLILISTDKLRDQYGNMKLSEAFRKADDVLTTAAKGIAEIITVPGYVNVDFEDVTTVMKDSGKAIMGSGRADGEGRAEKAIKAAIHSPLLNDSNIEGAKNILLYITSGTDEVSLDEVDEILEIAQNACGNNSDVIWGNGTDESLGNALSVTLIATGFNHDTIPDTTPTHPEKRVEPRVNVEKKVHVLNEPETVDEVATPQPKAVKPQATIETPPEPVKPEPITQPSTEERVVHSLFETVEEEPITDEIDEIDDTPAVVEPAPAPTVTETASVTPREEEKPTVRVFSNPFQSDSDDEGFEITSRIMTQEEVEAKAEQEVAVMEATKAKEVDPKEELRRQRLRALSINFRTQRGLEELESQPAYMRRDREITPIVDDDMSHYSASSHGLSDENSYLHKNVD